jgi:hypothetical protein
MRHTGLAVAIFTGFATMFIAATEPAPEAIGGSTMKRASTRPLSCRLNLRHQWRRYFTEDGARYQACAKCGKEMPPDPRTPLTGW